MRGTGDQSENTSKGGLAELNKRYARFYKENYSSKNVFSNSEGEEFGDVSNGTKNERHADEEIIEVQHKKYAKQNWMGTKSNSSLGQELVK